MRKMSLSVYSYDTLISRIEEVLSKLEQFRFGEPKTDIYCTSINVFRANPLLILPLGSIIIRGISEPVEYWFYRSLESAREIEDKVNEVGLNLVFRIVTDL